MAFGQMNTGFNVGFGSSPFSTGFSAGTTTQTKGSTKKKDNYTYNPRYPGFDENDYKRLEQIVMSKGVTGAKFDELMDEAYQHYLPQVQNKHKLAERGEELNQVTYDNIDAIMNKEGDASEKIKMSRLAQKLKETYGVPYDYPDDELLDVVKQGTANWNKLLYDYLYNDSDDLLYEVGIYEPEQGGIKSMINPASEGGILAEGGWNAANLIGWGTETIDNAAGKFADKLTVRGTKSAENLKQEIENMSPEEQKMWREQFNKEVKNKGIGTAYTQGNTIVERLWNGIKGDVYYPDDDEAFMKWLIDKKANLGQSLIGADDILKGESNPNVIRFFSNIPASAVKTFTATVRGMTNPYDTMKGIYKLAATPEGHQALLERYGSWDALAEAMNSDPVGVADDILAVAELGTNLVGAGMKATGKMTGNANLMTKGANLQGSIGSANDVLAQKAVGGIYGLGDSAAKWVDDKSSTLGTVAKGVNRYAQDVSSAQKLAEDTVDVYNYVKEPVKNFTSEMANKIIGISEEDRKFIRENAKLVNENLDGTRTVDTTLDNVKKKFAGEELKNSKMGQEYEALRQKGQTASTEGLKNDMKATFDKNKIRINANGDLEFDKLSKYNATQQKAIKEAREVIKDAEGAGKVDAGTILDLRQKLDDMINWEGKSAKASAVDRATESLIKDMRGALDARAKAQIPGLEKLDAKYSEAMQQWSEIRKDWFDSNGNLKDSARSKLRNLTKAGNEEKLARLEKVIPGIEKELKALDVGLTVQRATSQGVGQYAKGGLITAGITTAIHNPALGIPMAIAGVFATPKNFVKIIENFPDIGNKINLGIALSPAEIGRLEALASRIQDGMEIEE